MYKTKINLQFSKPNNAKNKIKKIRIERIDTDRSTKLCPQLEKTKSGRRRLISISGLASSEIPRVKAIHERNPRSKISIDFREGWLPGGWIERERERERNISIFSSHRTTRGTWPSCALRCIREWERCATHGVITLRVPISILDSLRFTKRVAQQVLPRRILIILWTATFMENFIAPLGYVILSRNLRGRSLFSLSLSSSCTILTE